MGSKVASIYAEVGLDPSNFNTGAAGLSGVVDGLIDTISGINPAAAFAVTALTAMVGVMTEAEAAAVESARVNAKLEAVISATGSAAGYTAEEIDNLSTALSEQSGVDDDLIKNASAVLLTFREIGQQVFPEAMEAALDMSAVMGQDLQSSVVMLGKALNDPISGLTALKKVGVTFSDEQEKQIKNFIAMNDIASAQGVILQELQTEFGGAAKAMQEAGDGSERLAIAWGNWQESAGKDGVPTLRNINTALAENIEQQTASNERVHESKRAWQEAAAQIGRYNSEIHGTSYEYKALIDEQIAVNYAIDAMNERAEMMGEYWANQLPEAIDKTSDSLASAADNLAALQAGLSGEFEDTWSSYVEGSEELAAKQSDLNAELEKAIWYYGANSEEVATLRDRIADTADAQNELAQKTDEAIKKMIYQQVVAKASTDVQLELARAMGILSEEDYNIAKATEAIIDQGQIDVVDPNEVDQLAKMADVITGLKSKNIEITFDALLNGVQIVDANVIAQMITDQIVPLIHENLPEAY